MQLQAKRLACISAGEQLPVLYYKEGERLSELSNYVREWEDQLVEVQTCFLAQGLHCRKSYLCQNGCSTDVYSEV